MGVFSRGRKAALLCTFGLAVAIAAAPAASAHSSTPLAPPHTGPGITGRNVHLMIRSVTDVHSIKVDSTDKAVLRTFAGDPSTQASSVRIQVVNSDANDSFDKTYDTTTGWRAGPANALGIYRFRSSGPITKIDLNKISGRLGIDGASVNDMAFSLKSKPTAVNVVFTVGETTVCMSFHRRPHYLGHNYVDTLAPAPSSCPAPAAS